MTDRLERRFWLLALAQAAHSLTAPFLLLTGILLIRELKRTTWKAP